MTKPSSRRVELLGWGAFLVSAVLFIASTARSGDWLGLGGSVLFLLGCLIFLVPLTQSY